MVSFDVSIDVASGAARSTASCWLEIDGTEVTGTERYSYHRTSGGTGVDTNSFGPGIIDVTANEKLQVCCSRFGGTDTLETIDDGSSFYVEWVG